MLNVVRDCLCVYLFDEYFTLSDYAEGSRVV